MRIAIIGAGNLATHLTKALIRGGHTVVQVFSRTEESASELGCLTDVPYTCKLSEIVTDAEIYIFSVKDAVLEELVSKIAEGREHALFIHTAGSMPVDLFKDVTVHYGVLYPMQSFTKNRDVDFSTVPCFLEASSEEDLLLIRKLAGSVSGQLYELDSVKRKQLHLAAVFACNFVNHCYAQAADLLESHGIPFEVMLPLIDETAAKVHDINPSDAQTGPAVRYDRNVIERHLKLLEADEMKSTIYDLMSRSIHRTETLKKT